MGDSDAEGEPEWLAAAQAEALAGGAEDGATVGADGDGGVLDADASVRSDGEAEGGPGGLAAAPDVAAHADAPAGCDEEVPACFDADDGADDMPEWLTTAEAILAGPAPAPAQPEMAAQPAPTSPAAAPQHASPTPPKASNPLPPDTWQARALAVTSSFSSRPEDLLRLLPMQVVASCRRPSAPRTRPALLRPTPVECVAICATLT